MAMVEFTSAHVIDTAVERGSKWERPLSATPNDVEYSVKRKQSLQARYVYGFIFFMTNLFAWFIRDYGHKVLAKIRVCGVKGNGCFHGGGVLRVSFGCFIYFFSMCVTSFRAKKLDGAHNLWHSRWWALKFVLYLISMIFSFYIPEDFILLYGEVARIGAGIFLALQLISVIHFITWCNDHWLPDSRPKQCYLMGLFLCTVVNLATFCAISLMYITYAAGTVCILNSFLITWTAFLVTVMMVVSLHSKVNRGLLSSAIMGSYTVFLCWSSIQSEPPTDKCNRQNEMTGHISWITILSFLIAICAIVMATFSTGIDSKAFQFRKDKTRTEDDIPYEYGFFHFIFSIGAMHFAMLFINWEQDQPSKKWSIDVGWASTWVKVINEWFAATLYLWKLLSPLLTSENIMDREDPAHLANGSV